MRNELETAGYICLNNGVWSKTGYAGINYTDGESVEDRIGSAIEKASDLSVLSNELRAHCVDWPSTYHLSPNRANLLRPLKNRLSKARVLEIGSGCGAITRYLGENAQSVLALEGTSTRARITRSRTRDLSNVEVVCEDFNLFDPDTTFDVITLIGVLEYAAVFTGGAEPHASMLATVKKMLAPGGVLVLAIENQLGLKYFAGAAEDHLSIAGYGIEGQYKAGEPRTFGRAGLDVLLSQAGFAQREFFAPFPDYKLPVSIVSERGIAANGFDPSPLAQLSVKRDLQLPQLLNFAPERVWPVLFENQVGMEFSNSFLVCASLEAEDRTTSKADIIAWHYSTDRLKKFCKETLFVKNEVGHSVHYALLAAKDAYQASEHLELSLPVSANYVKGKSLLDELQKLVSRPGWTVQEVGVIFQRYIAFLDQHYGLGRAQVSGEAETTVAPGECVDILPHNLIVDAQGGLNVIDEEWTYRSEIPVAWLIFRSALALVRSVSRFGSTSSEVGTSHWSFITAVAESAGCPLSENLFQKCAELEEQLQNEITGAQFKQSLVEQLKKSPLLVQTNSTEANKLFGWLSEARKEAEDNAKYFNDVIARKDEESKHLRLEHLARIEQLEKEQRQLNAQLEARNAQLQTILNSKSMLLTKPVRVLGRLMRGDPLRISEASLPAQTQQFLKPVSPENIRDTIVVLPVYRDVEVTRQCLNSALPDILGDVRATLILVNDASPDAGMLEMLRATQAAHPTKVELIDNPVNLGFVKSVNKGMQVNEEADVLLLNSDVILPKTWLSRMRAEAYAEKAVATVTPLSNNTTICTFPDFLQDNGPPMGLSVDQIDEAFQDHRLAPIEAPTGIGFCMFIRREAIDAVGYFDEQRFGRGYGEENDFCQKVLQHGFKNLITPNLYVFHKGGVSFGGDKAALVENAQAQIDKLYPAYSADVQNYIKCDGLKPARIYRLCKLLSITHKPKVLHLSHGLGGGVDQHIEELEALVAADAYFLLILPISEDRVVLRLGARKTADELFFSIPGQYDELLTLLKILKVTQVHFHHTLRLPKRMMDLASDLGLPYFITVHDYYMIAGNPTLTDSEGEFSGEAIARLQSDNFPLEPGTTIEMFQRQYAVFLSASSLVIFPSTATRSLMGRVYSDYNGLTAYHSEEQRELHPPTQDFAPKATYNLIAVGAIGREKGADLLESTAEALAARKSCVSVKLIGYAYRPLSSSVKTSGPYENWELRKIIEREECDLFFFTSRCPETYSYTLSFAMTTGKPIVAPDVGAFPERLAGRDNVLIYNLSLSAVELADAICEFIDRLQKGVVRSNTPPSIQQGTHDFYPTGYLSSLAKPSSKGSFVPNHDHTLLRLSQANLEGRKSDQHAREKVLAAVWWLYSRQSLRRVFALVPLRHRRGIKRFLSRKPLHEVFKRK